MASRVRPQWLLAVLPAVLLGVLLLQGAAVRAAVKSDQPRDPVSVSGVIVVDDDGMVIIQDDSGVDYLVKSPDLSRFSGEGIIGEGQTWTDENGDQVLELSGYEIIDIVLTPQEDNPPADKEHKAQEKCPTSARAAGVV